MKARYLIRCLAILAALFCCPALCGQDAKPLTPTWDSPEFGDVSELRGKSKVYVYCEDFKIRQVIVNELKKYPRLQIVGSADEAEFLVNFTYRYVTTYSTGIFSSAKTTIHSGDLIVSIAGRVDQDNRVHQRIVWSTQNERKTTFGKNPAKKGAQKFMEALKNVPDEITSQPAQGSNPIQPDNPLLGTWKITASNDQGPIKDLTFSVTQQGGQLAGMLKSNDGIARVERISSDGRTFSLVASEKHGADVLTVALTGIVSQKLINGTMILNDGSQVIPLTFIGTRLTDIAPRATPSRTPRPDELKALDPPFGAYDNKPTPSPSPPRNP